MFLSMLFMLLLISNIFLYINLKIERKYEAFYEFKSVPDIELINTFNKKYGITFGGASGFIKFENIDNQPKNARQYYIIKPIDRDNEGRTFSLENIIKLQYLPPKSLGTVKLKTIKNEDNELILEDDKAGRYYIDKENRISIIDFDGEKTTLITNQLDFFNFMENWLLKN